MSMKKLSENKDMYIEDLNNRIGRIVKDELNNLESEIISRVVTKVYTKKDLDDNIITIVIFELYDDHKKLISKNKDSVKINIYRKEEDGKFYSFWEEFQIHNEYKDKGINNSLNMVVTKILTALNSRRKIT